MQSAHPAVMSVRHSRMPLLGVGMTAYLVALIIGCGVSVWLQAPFVGFAEADEPSHFLNAYFVKHYLADALGTHPVQAAQSFYLHFPKLAIGHWPPVYYGIVGVLFFFIPATPTGAMVVNLAVASLPAVCVAYFVRQMGGHRVHAVLAAVIYAGLPLVLRSQLFFLADQAVTIVLCAATIAWVRYTEHPSLARSLVFAMLASTAVLTKGNGWLVGLVPVIHMLLTSHPAPLKNWRTYMGAAAFIAAVVPWYALTFRISADGFLFKPGLAYAATALASNSGALLRNLGIVGIVLLTAGAWGSWTARQPQMQQWRWAAACISLFSATVIFQSLAPAALDPRYMTPALPPAVALIALGIKAVAARVGMIRPARGALLCTGLLTVTLLAPGVQFVLSERPKVDMRLNEAVDSNTRPVDQEVLLIDGSPGAEGGLIAAAAVTDPERLRYVVRASQLLSDSDWNATRYRLKHDDPRKIVDTLRTLGVNRIVIVRREGEAEFAHSRLLRQILASEDSGYQLKAVLDHRHRQGSTHVYESRDRLRPNLPLVRATNFPSKAAAFGVTKQ